MQRDTHSRKYLLTCNNPQDKGATHEKLKEIISGFKSIIYYCMADEVGSEEHTFHTHIYLHFSSSVRFSTIKNQFGNISPHIDVSRGSAIQNRDYIFKENKHFGTEKETTNLKDTHYEWGTIPIERQGSRSDLAALYELIKSGATNAELLEENPNNMQHLMLIDRTRKTVLEEKYKNEWRSLTVTYIWGKTNIGKTRYVMEKQGYSNCYRVTDYSHPWDSYNLQKTILLDEYSSNIKLTEFLPIIDGYPVELSCRYSNKQAVFFEVVVVSNIPLNSQYPSAQIEHQDIWQAFLRRINRIYEFLGEGMCIPYQKVMDKNGFQTVQPITKKPMKIDEAEKFMEQTTTTQLPETEREKIYKTLSIFENQ